jgi:hypothetical protein
MKIVGLLAMFQGIMLLIGEYLCVEVAWRCMDYNQLYTSLGALLLGIGMIAAMIGANHD